MIKAETYKKPINKLQRLLQVIKNSNNAEYLINNTSKIILKKKQPQIKD